MTTKLEAPRNRWDAYAEGEDGERISGLITSIDIADLPPSITTLNKSLFKGRLEFACLWRSGSLILAGFAGGAEAIWRKALELGAFGRAQSALFEGTGELLPTLPSRKIRTAWEPIAQLIRSIADQDSITSEPSPKDEFRQIIRTTWEKAERPEADDRDAFNKILRECLLHKRDRAAKRTAI